MDSFPPNEKKVDVAAAESSKRSTYPAPFSSHELVAANPSLFWESLRFFHKIMGTKSMVPVVGGKELNLHVLYAEVTKRGGFEKVVSEKKWKEVSRIFGFGPTTTSASYSLRKHYTNLLLHYEQVYFFRSTAPPPRTTGLPDSHAGPLRFEAVGTIEGKFDCGYLVSVKLGSEILSGVLYHPDHGAQGPSSSFMPKPRANVVPLPHTPHPQAQANHAGRRKRKRRGDPGRPKPNRSGYNFFFAEKHAFLKTLYPNREREFTKMIGDSWNNLTPEERTVYQNYGLQDKERYQREMKEYKERMILIDPKPEF